jgi:hypothetical protein
MQERTKAVTNYMQRWKNASRHETRKDIDMISWKTLIEYIEKLQELPNGSGSEIEFHYKGIEYCICSYKESCDIQKGSDCSYQNGTLIYSDEKIYTYRTLSELGKAKDIGFSVEECWNEFTEVHIEPNFDNYPFEKIYASYEAACKKHNWL